MEDMIRVQGLSKRYEDFALEDITFSVPAGVVVGLIGSNGAGKTTTLKAILGLTTPDAGIVELLGCNPDDPTASTMIDKVKERVGIVLDTCAFPAVSRVADIAALGRAAYAKWDDGYFNSLCASFGLERNQVVNARGRSRGSKAVEGLSRGMGMKLTLAFALSHHSDLLVLDEATAGLDPMARDEVLDILRGFMEDEGHAILLSTHITSDLEKIADELICIEDGRMVFDLPKDAICDGAGIAHCRATELESLANSELASCELRILRRGMGTDVLVADRFAFARTFPEIPIDRATIEDYMTLTFKGELLKEDQT